MDQSSITPNTSNQQLVINGDNDSATALLHEKQSRRRITLSDVTFREYMTIGILCFVNLINYMDRFTLAGVLDEVKADFKIGDDKAGLLQTVFVIAYMVFAPIFGYLGDRYSRRLIMAFGVALWSITTFAGSYIYVFRILKTIGSPSAYNFCGFGYIVGSVVGGAAGNWRWGLRVTPILGAVAVALILWVMENPERGQAEESRMKPTSYTEDLRSLVKNPSFMLSTLAFTCVAFVTGALAWWGPQFIFLGLTLQPKVNITQESISDSKCWYQESDVDFNEKKRKTVFVYLKYGIKRTEEWSLKKVKVYIIYLLLSYQRLRVRMPGCDPVICAMALLASAPLVYLALAAVEHAGGLSYFLVFLGMLTCNLTWSIVADIVLVRRPATVFQ
ncbi:jg16613 [Pararge aegeria aegeria]|uniref:Jg16613 protein n=1 Tax=Pararge aegeria aegeria TaxID=348720 RepID=A0A8S4R7H0_9NEOP|nr:jg16613 [Pararge aegeria aegeria]